ncbi:hypothetical protein CYMTET_28682, partial [Cymbomonas tetramitiformis]
LRAAVASSWRLGPAMGLRRDAAGCRRLSRELAEKLLAEIAPLVDTGNVLFSDLPALSNDEVQQLFAQVGFQAVSTSLQEIAADLSMQHVYCEGDAHGAEPLQYSGCVAGAALIASAIKHAPCDAQQHVYNEHMRRAELDADEDAFIDW